MNVALMQHGIGGNNLAESVVHTATTMSDAYLKISSGCQTLVRESNT